MKKPRLTDADRLAIESRLRSGHTAYAIAKAPACPETTTTREIKETSLLPFVRDE